MSPTQRYSSEQSIRCGVTVLLSFLQTGPQPRFLARVRRKRAGRECRHPARLSDGHDGRALRNAVVALLARRCLGYTARSGSVCLAKITFAPRIGRASLCSGPRTTSFPVTRLARVPLFGKTPSFPLGSCSPARALDLPCAVLPTTIPDCCTQTVPPSRLRGVTKKRMVCYSPNITARLG